MSFDPALALDDWLATGKLSRRKLAALNEAHARTIEVLPQAVALDTAPSEYAEAAQLPAGASVPVVVAAVLDFADPINSTRNPLACPVRTIELLAQLVALELMGAEEADACLNAMGHGN